ncbi:hypothetical protein PQR53_27460 [Paraburkholderia fungorum]|uniref:LysR substrate-binding domain-containing protein n=1 Tax=Paraburkholderia fungorum TaxID=134537 RepID=UPI0038BC5E5F
MAYVSHGASGIESSLISSSSAVCAFPANHPLGRKAVLGPTDLWDEQFIALSLLGGTGMKVDQRFREAGIVPRNSTLETPFEATVCAMIAGESA